MKKKQVLSDLDRSLLKILRVYACHNSINEFTRFWVEFFVRKYDRAFCEQIAAMIGVKYDLEKMYNKLIKSTPPHRSQHDQAGQQ